MLEWDAWRKVLVEAREYNNILQDEGSQLGSLKWNENNNTYSHTTSKTKSWQKSVFITRCRNEARNSYGKQSNSKKRSQYMGEISWINSVETKMATKTVIPSPVKTKSIQNGGHSSWPQKNCATKDNKLLFAHWARQLLCFLIKEDGEGFFWGSLPYSVSFEHSRGYCLRIM